MKVLVLTSEPISAAQLGEALSDGTDPADAEVLIVAPALHANALRFWLSDADEAIERADQVRRASADQLGRDGISVAADTGEGDLFEAVSDALQTFAADRIVLFAHPPGDQRHGEGVDAAELLERFGVPVDHAEVPAAD